MRNVKKRTHMVGMKGMNMNCTICDGSKIIVDENWLHAQEQESFPRQIN